MYNLMETQQAASMTYHGRACRRIIELDEPLAFSEGQRVSVSVAPEDREDMRGTAAAILRVAQKPPFLNREDVDALDESIRAGRLPVRDEGLFDQGPNR